jgi:hypothetical protein
MSLLLAPQTGDVLCNIQSLIPCSPPRHHNAAGSGRPTNTHHQPPLPPDHTQIMLARHTASHGCCCWWSWGGRSKSPDNRSFPASETNHQLQVLLLAPLLLLPGVAPVLMQAPL